MLACEGLLESLKHSEEDTEKCMSNEKEDYDLGEVLKYIYGNEEPKANKVRYSDGIERELVI